MLHELGLGGVALGKLEQDGLDDGINGGSAHGRLNESTGRCII